MGNVRLCDALQPCCPSFSDDLCVRCVKEQYDNLIDEIDDCECLDFYDFDDISEYNREINVQLENIDDDLPF